MSNETIIEEMNEEAQSGVGTFETQLINALDKARAEGMNGLLLAQNKEQYKGYTVFEFKFSGKPIKFMTLADVKAIIEQIKK